MRESVVESVLSPEEVLESLRNGLVKVGVDNSLRGETQYFLYPENHYDGMYDVFRTVFIGSISGYAELVESNPQIGRMFGDEKDILEEFILRNGKDKWNPTDISAYISRFKGIVLVFYRDEDSDEIRFMSVLPDNEHNRKYVIYELSPVWCPIRNGPRLSQREEEWIA